ncbi:hypothetical protein VTN49DRAFT_6476 [Thermomyces lanuginosus]|uniref:uncharacterized protein n=1 Tax=Thermomyces lanuginosus TaxID=5541 RepID=UPI003743EB08
MSECMEGMKLIYLITLKRVRVRTKPYRYHLASWQSRDGMSQNRGTLWHIAHNLRSRSTERIFFREARP